MQIIKEHIKNNQFRPAYLLYGTESYLKKLYQDKLKEAVLSSSDDINFSCFEGKGIDEAEVVSIAQTLPFFSEKRLLLIRNSGFFKNQNTLTDFIKDFPDTTVLIFVETEVDKRSRLFKAVKEIGYVSEMNGMDEKNLKLWIASLLQKEKKRITEQTISYFISKSGMDMKNLSNEVEKLVCFAYNREVIVIEDIDAICSTQITGKIFQMIDAIGFHKQTQALTLYYDLLALREKPMSILYLLTRHFNILLQIKELSKKGYAGSVLAKKVAIPPFAVNKYIAQSKNFKHAQLMDVLQNCADTEEQVKSGRLAENMGVEVLIVTYSCS
ncbi:MAG: DNA polymerase III subunit delta [Velocimicrobium sp.]